MFKAVQKLKNIVILTGFLMFFGIACSVFAFWNGTDSEKNSRNFESGEKKITLVDDGLAFKVYSRANTAGDFLEEQKLALKEKDNMVPSRNAKIYSGAIIHIERAKKIKIAADGKKIESYTLQKKVEDAVWENGVILNRLDIADPSRGAPVYDGISVKITRINIEEIVAVENIDFKTITENDNKLGWREEKIKQKGEKGTKEIKYRITYNDGKEISRKVLETKIVKEPVMKKIIKGTYVELGKSHKGLGTWYSYTGTLSAASPWLPMGSYAKVTNPANGKSVIVKINDRGPFGKGRIIDLDKVAFQKIASLGAGVINVKVEEILN